MPPQNLLAAKQFAFDPVLHLLDVYKQTSKLESKAGELKQVFFSLDAVKAYREKVVGSDSEACVIRLGESSQALYDFTWDVEEDTRMRYAFKLLWRLLIDIGMAREKLHKEISLSSARMDSACQGRQRYH